MQRTAWLWELRAPHPARGRRRAPDCSRPMGHQTHLSPSFCPYHLQYEYDRACTTFIFLVRNITRVVTIQNVFSSSGQHLLGTQISAPLSGWCFPPQGSRCPVQNWCPQQEQVLNVFVLLDSPSSIHYSSRRNQKFWGPCLFVEEFIPMWAEMFLSALSIRICQCFELFLSAAEQFQHPPEVSGTVCSLLASSIIIWSLKPSAPPKCPHCLKQKLHQPSEPCVHLFTQGH